jgi:hypothetical protein
VSSSSSAFAEAAAAAVGADAALRAACGDALLRQSPSTWREESLRVLLMRALADDDNQEAERLASVLPAALVLEERLVCLAARDPVTALAAAGQVTLPARAWRRLLSISAAALRDADSPMTRDLVASALCAALTHLPPAIAFLEAVRLARCFAEDREIDIIHLLALSTTTGLTVPARADLLLAIAAALAARGATDEAATMNAEAAMLAREGR